jgi:hypothetical protein
VVWGPRVRGNDEGAWGAPVINDAMD